MEFFRSRLLLMLAPPKTVRPTLGRREPLSWPSRLVLDCVDARLVRLPARDQDVVAVLAAQRGDEAADGVFFMPMSA